MNAEPQLVACVAGVGLHYRKSIALTGINLNLPAGRMIGFIGPDGVGKSSLLALIAGARKIQSGRVIVLGGDMADRRHRARVCPRIAYMPQGLGRNLYPNLVGLREHRILRPPVGLARNERQTRIRDLLQATALPRFRTALRANSSGGMRQKLGLCSRWCMTPTADPRRPTTGIDPLSRRHSGGN